MARLYPCQLKYFTRLTAAKDGRVMVDTRRENIIVGRYTAEDRWELINKIGVKAKMYAEGEGGGLAEHGGGPLDADQTYRRDDMGNAEVPGHGKALPARPGG